MSMDMWLALSIFLLTFVLISVRRFRWLDLKRPTVAMLGAGLMVLLGVVGPEAGSIALHRSVWLVLAILGAVLLGFLAAPLMGVPLALVAFIGGSMALFLTPLANRRTSPRSILQGVDWTLLLFFVGLFVVLKGLATSGLLEEMEAMFESVSSGAMGTIPGLSAFTAVLSNLVSNVPAVILLAPFVEQAGQSSLWLALAASSTLAGNATILGAAANIIVAEGGEKLGVEFPFWRFVRAGLPITIASLLVSIVVLELLY